MRLKTLPHLPILGPLIQFIWRWDADQKYGRIRPHLIPGGKVLEVGSGPGTVARRLLAAGYAMDGVDVVDHSWFPDIRPRLYDGRTLPYGNQSYDCVLLLTVLHHCHDPDRVLAEAARVGRRVIIIEDIYRNQLQKWLTCAVDSLANLEFRGHPHQNRTDRGWRKSFRSLGLLLRYSKDYRFLGFFRQAVYVLGRD